MLVLVDDLLHYQHGASDVYWIPQVVYHIID